MFKRILIDFKEDKNGCFNCTSHKIFGTDYPTLWLRGKKIAISHTIYEECFGIIPKGMCVCHKCDNHLCINPEHLFLGTHKDNTQDMIKKGRDRHGVFKGEEHGCSKLTNDDIFKIRDDKRYCREIALDYGVALCTIARIKKGTNWKHLIAC
jgi:hypothetical protein